MEDPYGGQRTTCIMLGFIFGCGGALNFYFANVGSPWWNIGGVLCSSVSGICLWAAIRL